ncbi:hypothetical protein Ahy_A02g006841 [Arachis hypogaea]|uniref:Uncharacterized protein n=1 Tax=Arachis hypogaea TaxID=3818 RepID=A0A445EBF1_ARAHY|nr:hypothetical protein Ahy_A02g006841 [Arachis hypogaea]
MYDNPWPSYTKNPVKTKERWFQKWAEKFIWDRKHDLIIRKIYGYRIARRLQQLMQDIRPNIKRALDNHFSINEGFRYHCLTNRGNRASRKSSKYTGGSATFMKMKNRLSKLLECEITLAETFKYTHSLKANNERFANE